MLFERLMEKLKGHRQEVENLILHNKIDTFETYRFLTGKLKGIQDSIDICRETFKRMDNE